MNLISIKRLLVYRLGQIGDTVAALPALWAIREQLSQAQLTMLSEVPREGKNIAPEKVLPASGLIDAYLKYESRPGWQGIPRAIATALRLRRERFDAVAYLAPTIRQPRHRQRDEFFFKLAGLKHRLGFRAFPEDSYPRDAKGQPLPVTQEADALLARLKQDGFTIPEPGKGRMDLALTSTERARAQDWLHTQAITQPWVAICAGAKWTSKKWDAARFQEIGKRIHAELGLLPVVMGGPEDREQAQALVQAWGHGAIAAGELSVRESAALMEHAKFYLGNDTGVMHLASAVGIPCINLFSALDWPGRWLPYGDHHINLRAKVDCAGCLSAECPHQNLCMDRLSVDLVWQACQKLHSSLALTPSF